MIQVSIIALMATSMTTSHQPVDDPLTSVLSCRAIENSQERLACFDAATAALDQEVNQGDLAVVSRQDIEAVEQDSFGFRMPSLPRLSLTFLGSNDNASSSDEDRIERDLVVAENSNEARVVERGDEGQIDRIEMFIDRVSTVGYDTKRVYMTNGQAWEVVSEQRFRIPRRRDGGEDRVEIRRASLDSFLMEINGRGAAYRVRRVQ